jgi:hypothetical protein
VLICRKASYKPVDDIEQVHKAKVLGVILNHKFRFDSHVQFILRLCSRRLYLVKLLRKQGLPPKKLTIVYQALITSRIQCAISAWGGFINTDWKRKIDAFLLRSYRAGYVEIMTLILYYSPLIKLLFCSTSSSDHRLYTILLAIKTRHYELWDRSHELVLPKFRTVLHRQSFLTRHH